MEKGEDEIFPDRLSRMIGPGWIASPIKEFERQNAELVQPRPIAA
jgi:hypothetical protein